MVKRPKIKGSSANIGQQDLLWLCYLSSYASSHKNCLHSRSDSTATAGPTDQCWQNTSWFLAFSPFSNFPIIISILFGKLAKSQAQAAATLDVFIYLLELGQKSNGPLPQVLSWGKINVNWLSSCVQIADWHTILKALIIAKVISDPKTINKNLQMGRVTCHAKQWPTTTSKEISNHARLIGHLSKTEKMIPYYK